MLVALSAYAESLFALHAFLVLAGRAPKPSWSCWQRDPLIKLAEELQRELKKEKARRNDKEAA
jgi:hypothetical protein